MENIELRSDKARRVIGEIPPRLVRFGTSVLTLLLFTLGIAICTIHYPITIEATGVAINDSIIETDIPYKYIHLFDEKRMAHVTLEGETASSTLTFVHHEQLLKETSEGNFFSAYILIGRESPKAQRGQKASVCVLVSDKTFLELVLGR